jgi:hypothetical protein
MVIGLYLAEAEAINPVDLLNGRPLPQDHRVYVTQNCDKRTKLTIAKLKGPMYNKGRMKLKELRT